MGCGTSAPSRASQPAVIGPASNVPHHPETNPSELYKIVSRRPDRIRTVSPRTAQGATAATPTLTTSPAKDMRSPQSSELPQFDMMDTSKMSSLPGVIPESPAEANSTANPRLRSLDSEVEQIWETSTSASNVGRLPRHTLASLLRTVFDFLPSTVDSLTVQDCEEALGRAFRLFPAFMPEDANGNIASPPRTGTNEENAKKDMRAWIMATSFDRPTTPIGHCTKEPSPVSKAFNDTYMHIKARFNDHMRTSEEEKPARKEKEDKETDTDDDAAKAPKKSPRAAALASPRVESTQPSKSGGSKPGSPIQLSPTRIRRPQQHAAAGANSNINNTHNEDTNNSFLDRDTIRISHDVMLEECEQSEQGSMALSMGTSSLTPSTAMLVDTASHGAASSVAGRPTSPTRTLRSIQAYRAMRDVGLSKNKKRLSERIISWIELVILMTFEDEANQATANLQTATRSIAQTAAPLNAANLATLQSQLNALRARAAATTLHPSPDNDDFFMNVPSAICWYYGAEPFYGDPRGSPSPLAMILPPCVLRYPYHTVYGFAVARTADITRRAVQKLSSVVAARETEISVAN